MFELWPVISSVAIRMVTFSITSPYSTTPLASVRIGMTCASQRASRVFSATLAPSATSRLAP